MQKDEHPKPQTTLEQLAKLPAVFKKDGTVTAGNASVSTSKPWFVEVSPLAVSKFVVTVVVSFLSHLWLPAASPGEKDFCFFFNICNVCVDLAILFSFRGEHCWTSALQTSRYPPGHAAACLLTTIRILSSPNHAFLLLRVDWELSSVSLGTFPLTVITLISWLMFFGPQWDYNPNSCPE